MRKATIAVLAAALVLAVAARPAFATNGYFSHGYGTHYKGMAGAGAALHLNSLAPATNPAAMAFLGPRFDISIALFNPNRFYNVTGNPSGLPGHLRPDPGRGGEREPVLPRSRARRELEGRRERGVRPRPLRQRRDEHQLARPASSTQAAHRREPLADVRSPDLRGEARGPARPRRDRDRRRPVVQDGRGRAASPPSRATPANLSDNGNSYSYGGGVRVGYLGDWSQYFSFGASYQTKIWMSEFDKYSGLFAEQGDFDIPANWVAGVAIKPMENLDIAIDVQQVLYSGVASIASPLLPNLMQVPSRHRGRRRLRLEGHDDGQGRGSAPRRRTAGPGAPAIPTEASRFRTARCSSTSSPPASSSSMSPPASRR